MDIKRAIEILTPDATRYTPAEYEQALELAREALRWIEWINANGPEVFQKYGGFVELDTKKIDAPSLSNLAVEDMREAWRTALKAEE